MTQQPNYSIPGAKILLLGSSGTGKTYSLRTLCDADVTPFILFTENGMRTLSDVPDEKIHWKYIPAAMQSFSDLLAASNTINASYDFEAIAKQKIWQKQGFKQFLDVASLCNNFICDRCGRSFGSLDTWRTDRAFVVDSLTGLSRQAMDNAVGSKPVKAPADWGVAMDNLERMIVRLTGGLQCHFVMTSHLEREKDEITGSIKLMPSTLGQKLAPKLGALFDDVVETFSRDRDTFAWRTFAPGIDLKGRNLGRSENLPPSFKPLIESWQKAGGIIQSTQTEAA